ncbi:MAG: DUF899 family protein [Gammaproteobacteria bacterium]|nr:DUF899 family protein [Gammaproteobacteria bacterium]NNC98121.1 DUF899 family protein [Gammaproteobacteria bacterium]NNM13185.1 DUF899 family protein [Gammaproteobacteria bacterium]
MSTQKIQDIQKQIFDLKQELSSLQAGHIGDEVNDYQFTSLEGEVKMSDLFGDKDSLLLIHNMGQGCRYCTLWADGFNGFLPHLESALSVALVSKDAPAVQRDFANSRAWRFRLASHGGGEYIQEQTVVPGEKNMPGVVVYERKDGKIYRKNSAYFGPGDNYCSIWDLLNLAGMSETNWTPQYRYWQKPGTMDDGGQNLNE